MEPTGPVTPAEAHAALVAVERGRRAAVAALDIPPWYWWSVAGGWLALGVLNDVGPSWLSLVATLAFGAVHSAIAPRVLDGRRRVSGVQLGADVPGLPLARLVLCGLVALVLVTVAVALALQWDGARHAATAAGAFVATTVLLGGPLLVATVRRRALRDVTRWLSPEAAA